VYDAIFTGKIDGGERNNPFRRWACCGYAVIQQLSTAEETPAGRESTRCWLDWGKEDQAVQQE
jgi:hypothetical protein